LKLILPSKFSDDRVSFSAGYFRDFALSQENPLLYVRVCIGVDSATGTILLAVCNTIMDRKNKMEQTLFCLLKQIYRKCEIKILEPFGSDDVHRQILQNTKRMPRKRKRLYIRNIGYAISCFYFKETLLLPSSARIFASSLWRRNMPLVYEIRRLNSWNKFIICSRT